jgi:hypothetical protein
MAVYFISAREVDLVKIGYAFNPVARFHGLRVASPVELSLEGAVPGGFREERELHQRFARLRVRGEWFMLCPDLREMIEASSRPEKFTWASVRVWLKHLEDESEIIEQKRLASLPPLPARDDPISITTIDEAHTYGWGRHDIKKLIAAGDIYFPFRETADA